MKFKRTKRVASPPFVSMADIVFNLVLFFVILAKVKQLEWEAATAAEMDKVPPAMAEVTVDKNNRLYFDAQQVSVDQLPDLLTERMERDPNGNKTVLLMIHKETQAATFEPIIEAVSKVGCEMVHVLEKETK